MLMVKLSFFLAVLETKQVLVLEGILLYLSAPKIIGQNMKKVKWEQNEHINQNGLVLQCIFWSIFHLIL